MKYLSCWGTTELDDSYTFKRKKEQILKKLRNRHHSLSVCHVTCSRESLATYNLCCSQQIVRQLKID